MNHDLIRPAGFRGRSLTGGILLCTLLPLGCYHYRAVPQQPASETAVGGSRGVAASGSETVWSLLWGAVQENPSIDNCQGQDLAEVTVHSNLAYALLTVATLGLVSPVRVEWYCARPNPVDDVIRAEAGASRPEAPEAVAETETGDGGGP